jgi:predicted nucleic acid-binding protein
MADEERGDIRSRVTGRVWENTQMKYKVFVNTNILLSGIFFEGNESSILDMVELDLITSEDAIVELRRVVRKRLRKYSHKLKEAEFLIKHKKDIPILAAVLYVKPDYFLTGDAHFFTENIKSIVNVITARDFLEKIK